MERVKNLTSARYLLQLPLQSDITRGPGLECCQIGLIPAVRLLFMLLTWFADIFHHFNCSCRQSWANGILKSNNSVSGKINIEELFSKYGGHAATLLVYFIFLGCPSRGSNW